jgi:hypothetical protein
MSVSNLVGNFSIPDYSLAFSAGGVVAGVASSLQPKVLVWSGVITTDGTGTTTATWTYGAGAPHLFKAGDYVVCSILPLLATDTLTAVLTPAATATTDTLVITGTAAPHSVYTEVWRTSA